MIPATAAKPAAKPSPTTVAANLFVAAHMDRAAALGDQLALTASRNLDGNRAWVIRDTLSKLPNDSERLRQMLEGIRRRPTRSGLGDSSTANPGAAPRPPISQLEG
jgi:hypothetical protein